jgi:hypothetical protein
MWTAGVTSARAVELSEGLWDGQLGSPPDKLPELPPDGVWQICFLYESYGLLSCDVAGGWGLAWRGAQLCRVPGRACLVPHDSCCPALRARLTSERLARLATGSDILVLLRRRRRAAPGLLAQGAPGRAADVAAGKHEPVAP